jgi:hypothetical protein
MSDATKILTTMMMLGMMAGGEFSSQPVDFDLQDDLQDKAEGMMEVDSDKSEEVME